MFKRRIEVDLFSLAAIVISYSAMMYGLVEIAYAVGKMELRNEITQSAIVDAILSVENEEPAK